SSEILSGITLRSALRCSGAKRMFGTMRLAPSVRIALERRCSGACEACRLEWRWALYVVRLDENTPCTAANLLVLCGRCSAGGDDSEENLQVLCVACHHHLQPCATGCGAWANKRLGVCRNCQMRRSLEQLMPGAPWEVIKARFPGFVQQWKAGYEPLPVIQS